MPLEWKIEQRKLENLYENPANPRQLSAQDAAHLRSSLEKFGLCMPIVIQPDGLIIGGHQRVRILKEMGVEETSVYVPDRALTDSEYSELSIRLNKNMGDWDYDILSSFWEIEELVKLGFSSEEMGVDPDKKSSKNKFKINVSFQSEDDLEVCYPHIEKIVNTYPGASCKKRIKK